MKRKKLITGVLALAMCFSLTSFMGCGSEEVGVDGKSAYELWLAAGNTGTEEEYLASLKGDQGAKGDQGEKGRGVLKTEINADGELIVYYTDNTSENLGKVVGKDGENAVPVDCDHEFYQFTLKEATCTEQGVILNVCIKDGGCGDTYITFTDKDPDNHDGASFEETTVQPTCEKDGYITKTCKRCGEATTIEANEENGLLAKGHSDEKVWITVVDEGANLCVDGGQKLLVCEDCLTDPNCHDCEDMIADSEIIEATGHDVTASWEVETAPTMENAGVLKGFCAKCGTNATVTLPKLTDKAYTKSIIDRATCIADGKDGYTITVGEWNHTFEVVTSTMHTYKGVKMDLSKVYTSGQVEVVFGNAPATCLDNSGKGSFTCDECKIAYIVSVSGDHVYTEENVIEEVASTCTKKGHKTYQCTVCENTKTVELDLLAHEYGEPNVTVSDDEIVTLKFTCTNCLGVNTIDCTEYEVKTNAATCQAEGSVVYTYKYTVNGEEKTGTYTVVLPKTHHSYNGKYIDIAAKFEINELKGIFGEDLAGLTTFGNSYTDCLTEGKGSFTCADCEKQYLIDITGDHEWTLKEKVASTCTEDGKLVYVCAKNAEHTKEVVNEDDPKSGHSFVLSETDSDFENGKLFFKCSNENCTETLEIEAESHEIKTDDATCKAEGRKYVVYTYIQDGVTKNGEQTLEILSVSALHAYGERKVDLDKVYTIEELKEIFGDDLAGLTTFGNSLTDCSTEGKGSFTCKDCGKVWLIDMKGDHKYGDWVKHSATCEEAGYSERTCSVCGDVQTEEGDPAKGHKYAYKVAKSATLTESGKLIVTCSNGDCEFSKEIVLPVLNDKDYKVEETEATCGQEGLTVYTLQISEDGIEYEYTERVTAPIVEHVGMEPPVEVTWKDNRFTYTGYYCSVCKQIIVTTKVAIAA